MFLLLCVAVGLQQRILAAPFQPFSPNFWFTQLSALGVVNLYVIAEKMSSWAEFGSSDGGSDGGSAGTVNFVLASRELILMILLWTEICMTPLRKAVLALVAVADDLVERPELRGRKLMLRCTCALCFGVAYQRAHVELLWRIGSAMRAWHVDQLWAVQASLLLKCGLTPLVIVTERLIVLLHALFCTLTGWPPFVHTQMLLLLLLRGAAWLASLAFLGCIAFVQTMHRESLASLWVVVPVVILVMGGSAHDFGLVAQRWRAWRRSMQPIARAATEIELAQHDDICAICFGQMHSAAETARLECGHIYCAKCLKPWAEVRSVCPKCQLPFGEHAKELATAAAVQAEAQAAAGEAAAAAVAWQAQLDEVRQANAEAARQAAINEMLADEAVGVDPAAREELLAAAWDAAGAGADADDAEG
jgi:hypothetical protein